MSMVRLADEKLDPEQAAGFFGMLVEPPLRATSIEGLGKLIREFALAGYRKGLAEAVEVYRGLHPGCCRVLSDGDASCNCFLCQIQRKAEAT